MKQQNLSQGTHQSRTQGELTNVATSSGFIDLVGDITSFAFSLARVRFCSEDFGCASSRSDDERRGGYALHYKTSYERNVEMQIVVKRGLYLENVVTKNK
jgi:hypothetical protein